MLLRDLQHQLPWDGALLFGHERFASLAPVLKSVEQIIEDHFRLAPLGLMGVVSLPTLFVFRPSGEDPHPVPWLRVLISCGIGDALYPHPQWAALARLWTSMYPSHRLAPDYARTLARLENRDATVAVVGLGYVGLPLASEFARAGFVTTGIDLDRRKVDAATCVCREG